MEIYRFGVLLEEVRKNYESQPLFELLDEKQEVKDVSYSEFIDDVKMKVNSIRNLPYERIALVGYNSYQWIVSFCAYLLAGKSLILPDVNLNDEELQALLLYSDTEYIETQSILAGELSFLEKIYSLGFMDEIRTEKLNSDEDGKENLDMNGDFICFTSGTTKNSKGVEISADTLAQHILQSNIHDAWKEQDKYYLPLPLHHIYPLTIIFHIMLCGGTICIGKGARYLKREIAAFNPQVAILVPSIIEFLFKKGEDVECLHTVFTAGSRCTEELAEKVRSTGIELFNYYGSSEMIGIVSASKKNGAIERLYPSAGVRFCIGEDDEIGVVSNAHMSGYYKKEEETNKVLFENCYWTGDIGALYEDGSICVRGRVRDTIVLKNGEKIHAGDTDIALSKIAGVKEAAIIYSSEKGIAAVIVLNNKEDIDKVKEAIRDYNRRHSPKQRIEKIYFQEEELPRTSSGKLKRRELEKRYFILNKEECINEKAGKEGTRIIGKCLQ